MGDWSAKRPCCCALDIDMDPLMVTGCLGEHVDLLLGDVHPRAVAQVFAHEGFEFVCSVDDALAHTRSIPDRLGRGAIGGQHRILEPLTVAMR